jgi:hypothetical protein
MKLDTGIIILLAVGLILGVGVSELQSRRINSLQTQIDELTIIVNERFLPALMLDKEVFNVR